MACNSRICIETNRVFDACQSRISLQNRQILVTFGEGVTPVNFVSLISTSTGTVSDLSVTPVNGTFSRVSYTNTVPLTVTATDAAGNVVYGTATVTFTPDVVLNVPSDAVFPVTIQSLASVRGTIGTFDGTTLTASYCAVVITKVVAEVELVIPAYGYLNIKECAEYSDNVCAAFLNQSLYPTTQS